MSRLELNSPDWRRESESIGLELLLTIATITTTSLHRQRVSIPKELLMNALRRVRYHV